MKKFIWFLTLCGVMLFPGLASAWDATVTSLSADPGQTISIDIGFSNNVDDVFAVDTTLNFDQNVLQLDTVVNGSEFAAFSKIDNLTTPGQARISQFGFTPMNAASGTVLTFNFTVLAGATPGASTISVTQLDFGTDTATIPANGLPITGTVTVNGAVNNPPVLNPIGNQSVQVGSTLQFTVSATDPDGDALSYTATPLPNGASFNGGTQTFSWTPTAGQEGTYNVTFGVDDGNGGTDSETITITVTSAPNNPPVLNAIGNQSVQAGNNLSFTVSASDPDGDTLTYGATPLPSGATFNTSTGAFSWTPTSAQTVNITFSVDDGNGGSDSEVVTITVTSAPNNPPVLDPIGNQSTTVGNNLSFTVTASDADGDTLTFGATPLPSGATFNSSTGAFSWTPTSAQTVNITFSVDDGNGGSDSEVVTITVTGGGGSGHDAVVASASVNAGDTFDIAISFSNNAADVFAVDTTLNWDPAILQANSVSNGATFAAFSLVDNLTVAGQATVSQFGFSPVSATSGDVLIINFTALSSGSTALTLNRLDFGTDTTTIPVNNVTNGSVTVAGGGNNPPVLDPIGDRSVQVGNNLSFTVTASDPDGDSLTFSASPLPSGATFNNGTFSWSPTAAQVGTFNVTFTVSDGQATDSETITITVSQAANNPPVLDPIGNRTVQVGDSLSITLNANDPDGDSLTFSAAPVPSGASFAGNTFTWTPQAGDEGSYSVTFTVSDGQATDSETITITVVPPTNAAEIVSPTPGSTLSSIPVTFQWTAGTNVSQYWFTLGSSSGGTDIASLNGGTNTSLTVTFELTGSPVFAQVWSLINGQWFPSAVVQYSTVNVPIDAAEITSPSNGSTLSSSPVNITWSAGTAASRYWLTVGTTSGGTDIYSADPGLVTSADVDVPLVGNQLYINIYSFIDGTWESGQEVVVNSQDLTPQITSPSNGSTLFGVPTTISWGAGSGVEQYWLTVGTTSQGTDIFTGGIAAGTTSADIAIPLTGDQMYVQLWTKMAGVWFAASEVVYNTPNLLPQFTSPAPGGTLSSTPINLVWSAGVGPERYWVTLGTSPAGVDLYSAPAEVGTTTAEIFAPLTGATVYANIYSFIGGKWYTSTEAIYNTNNIPLPIGEIQSPADGTNIDTSPVTLSWTPGNGVETYWITAGTTPNGTDVLNAGFTGTTSTSLNVPLTGDTIYVSIYSRWGGTWYQGTDVSYTTSTGAFVSSLNVPSIGSEGDSDVAVADGISANATSSVSQVDNASAAAEMILTYLWWDQNTNPEGPAELSDPNLSDQSALYAYGQAANSTGSTDGLDAQGLWAVVQDLDPASYDWTVSTRATVEEALSDLANVLATEVSVADGQPTVVPGAVAVGGSYDQWLVVTGVRATDNPNENATYGIDGFWVNNPEAEGLGSQTYVTAQQFANTYVQALTDVSDEDPNLGQFATIVHASTYGGQGTIVEQEAQWETPLETYLEVASADVNGAPATVYTRTYDATQAAAITASALNGVTDEVAKYDASAAAAVSNTTVEAPILVQSASGAYYLVPFADAEGAGTVAVAVVDAATGTFAEASWTDDPATYPAVSLNAAINAVAAETGSDDLSGAEVELIHTEGSLYQPVWKVYFAGEEYRVDASGNTTTASAVVE